MKRFYIFKDGVMQSSTGTKELAIDLIRQYQKLETHPLLRSEFSIIAGEEEFIPSLLGGLISIYKYFCPTSAKEKKPS